MYYRKLVKAVFFLCFFVILFVLVLYVGAESNTIDSSDTCEECTVSELVSSEYAIESPSETMTDLSNEIVTLPDRQGVCEASSTYAADASNQTLKNTGENLWEIVKIIASILFDSLAVGLAIWGICSIKQFRDKAQAATFTFWSQLAVRLTIIRTWLNQDCGLLDNLYDPNILKQSSTVLSPRQTRIVKFKEIVEDTLKYITETSDQMPAYRGWSEDYTQLIGYLEDMIVYDITDSSQYFLFSDQKTDAERKEYRNKICNTIDRICDGIHDKQQETEKKICRK